MNPITIPNITIPVIGLPTIGIPSVGFPSASGGGLAWPAGLKESIKAIYDPASQGMTNYDVIEAYVEDFTNWNYVKARGTVTVSQHKFIITECILNGLGIVEDVQEPYSNLTVRITGITDNQGVLITDYVNGQHQIINTITEDGIYTIEDRHHFIGFGCNFVGTCNITIEQLPTSILKDLSGNGNHAYLYGGKGKLNSGMGVYQEDFTTYEGAYVTKHNIIELTKNKRQATKPYSVITKNIESYVIEVTGIISETLQYGYRDETGVEKIFYIKKDGIYTLPKCYKDGTTGTSTGFISYNIAESNIITITQIPDYPNQLCYDGKMYAVCYGFPILTDYTVMADRTWFDNEGNRVFITKGNICPNCAFNFEKVNASLSSETFSYSQSTNIDDLIGKSGITYQTKQSYNGKVIGVGTSSDGDILLIGGQLKGEYIGCHGKIIIADRSFTEDEITWLKDNFFSIDIPTPAYDFDFSKLKSGENTFTDKYGNELSLYNFAWNGMSGLGGYGIDVSESLIQPNRFDYTYNDVSKEFVFLKALSSGTYLFNIRTNVVQTNQKIKITNIGRPIHFVNSATNETYYSITQDGIYDIDFVTDADTLIRTSYTANQELNLKVQFLPTYPNALVFDGVDDYCKLLKMTIKSVILDVVPNKQVSSLYDNRLNAASNWFSILNGENKIIAYNSHNDGFTYINGELNTTVKPNEIMNERNVICVVNEKSEEANQFIGASISLSGRANMVLYRITGFTEVLTPDQVWKWYQKNKPKGGDK